MRHLVIAVVAFVVACKKTPADEFQTWTDKMQAHHDKVCACKDEACVKAAAKDDLGKEMADSDLNKLPKPKIAAYNKLSDESVACAANYPGHAAAVLAKYAQLQEQACACKDKACADGVVNVYAKWTGENDTDHVKFASDADKKQASDMDGKIIACLQAYTNPK